MQIAMVLFLPDGGRELDDVGPDEALWQEAGVCQHRLLPQHLTLLRRERPWRWAARAATGAAAAAGAALPKRVQECTAHLRIAKTP